MRRKCFSVPFASLLIASLFYVAQPFTTPAAFGQTDIYVRGSGRLFPIALPQLCLEEGESEAARLIPKVIARNLDISGYFEVLNPASYIETPGRCGEVDDFSYSDWSVIGAEGLVKGTVQEIDGQITVQLFLHDVQRKQTVLGKEYRGDALYPRAIAHRFANEIMKFFTGEYGVFGTEIVYSSKVGRFKELFVMEMDGSNVRQLTRDRGLALSSSWGPQGESILYTTYRQRVPNIYRLSVKPRSATQITRDDSLELGAKLSSAGNVVLASRTAGRASDIVLLNLDGSTRKNLTRSSGAIDVSPDWSPDERRIVFCSNRGGGPQIYTMNADGSGVSRISFVNSRYCTSPDWSPRGDKIAFVCYAEGRHQIFIANPDGSAPLQLTSYGHNEDPSWSPDGRYLVFASTLGRGPTFNIALMKADGSHLRQLTNSRSGDMDPSWGPMPQ